MRKNMNRGYQKLRVWNDAIIYFNNTCKIVRKLPLDFKRVIAQEIAAADSVHRNIAEGYCRKSIKEYLNFLNIALSSLGESVSGIYALYNAKLISQESFNQLDILAYKLENGL